MSCSHTSTYDHKMIDGSVLTICIWCSKTWKNADKQKQWYPCPTCNKSYRQPVNGICHSCKEFEKRYANKVLPVEPKLKQGRKFR